MTIPDDVLSACNKAMEDDLAPPSARVSHYLDLIRLRLEGEPTSMSDGVPYWKLAFTRAPVFRCDIRVPVEPADDWSYAICAWMVAWGWVTDKRDAADMALHTFDVITTWKKCGRVVIQVSTEARNTILGKLS